MESGGVAQLRRKSGALMVTPTSPNRMDPLHQRQHRQEMQHDLQPPSCYSDEQYSDTRGYPSLPRPKAILSLSRAGLPWSLNQASTLSTVPVRVRKSWKTESKLSSVAQCASAEQSVKVNRGLPQSKQRKRKSLNGLGDLFRDRSHTSPAGPSEDKSKSKSIISEPVRVVNQMSNHSRVHSRREAQGGADGGGHEGSQQKTKKSRKPSKSMTFSFGSSSDLKRRTLGLLGRGEKKTRKTSPIPPTPATPNSPILMSRKAKTLPKNASFADYERKNHQEVLVHPKFNSCAALRYGSYQDVTSTRSPSRGKHRPPPLKNLSGSVGQHLCHTTDTDDASPLTDYSPGLTSVSGISSRPDSMESLSEVSHASSVRTENTTPPGLSRSPKLAHTPPNSHYKSPSNRRKMSDPMLTAPGDADSPKPPSRPGRTLKKRYTFCVRPSRLNTAEQEWVR